MDRDLKDRLDLIAHDAETTLPITVQVLLATGMHMGRNSQDAALRDALAAVMDLQGKLHSCRTIMEANDPGNAQMIFGPPLTPPAAPATEEAPAVT